MKMNFARVFAFNLNPRMRAPVAFLARAEGGYDFFFVGFAAWRQKKKLDNENEARCRRRVVMVSSGTRCVASIAVADACTCDNNNAPQ